jgi:hypothetical protein
MDLGAGARDGALDVVGRLDAFEMAGEPLRIPTLADLVEPIDNCLCARLVARQHPVEIPSEVGPLGRGALKFGIGVVHGVTSDDDKIEFKGRLADEDIASTKSLPRCVGVVVREGCVDASERLPTDELPSSRNAFQTAVDVGVPIRGNDVRDRSRSASTRSSRSSERV